VEATLPDQIENTVTPATAAALDGLSFSEAFQQVVLGDPEVAAAGKLAVSSKDYYCGEVFKTGEAPSLGYRWPLNLTDATLVDAFGYVPIMIIGGYEPPKPPPHPSLLAAAKLLADRWGLLIGILRRGEVVAVDMDDRKLGKGAWRRVGATVDVQNGDLFDDDSNKVPLYRGLMLCRAELAIEAQPITSIAPKVSTAVPLLDMSKLPKALQSIHVAVMELWQGTIPDLLRAGQRDKKIFDYLKSRPDLSTASSSSIKRYMQEYKAAAVRRRALRDRS